MVTSIPTRELPSTEVVTSRSVHGEVNGIDINKENTKLTAGMKFFWSTRQRLSKPICLGRNYYLFCISEQAAKNTSLIYSIIESCKMNGFRPVKYIADAL